MITGQQVAGLNSVSARIPITAEILTTVVNEVMASHGAFVADAAAGNFTAYCLLSETILRKAIHEHNVDARTVSPGEVARELYPRIALPGLHLNQPDEDRVRVAILDAVSFGATLGLSIHTTGGAKSPPSSELPPQRFEHMAHFMSPAN